MPQRVLRLVALLFAAHILSGCGAGGSAGTGVPTVTITSIPSAIAVSGTEQITAVAQDSSGNIIIGATFNWVSSAPSVATINAGSGLAMGLLPGTTQITASANGTTSAPVTLTVTPGFLAISPMVFARGRTTYTVLNDGNVLIAAGSNSGGILAAAELYIPASQSFSVTGNLNVARYGHSATLLNNGMVLIAGGVSSAGLTESAELYDPATGTFSLTGNLNAAREWFTATHLPNGMVLIAGGVGVNGPLTTAELYDPTTGTFSVTGNLNVPRSIASATLLNNGSVLIAGGMNSSGALSSAELYDPETGTFALTGSMSTARYAHSGTLLNTGSVLIAGGSSLNPGIDVPLNTAELYNPATGTFTVTGNLNTARLYASATLLNNGTVLLAGGDGQTNPNSVPMTSAELYDPTAGTFSVTGSLVNPRATQGAALLPNGDVLLAGGYDLPVKAPAELYEPGPLTPPGLQSISVAPVNPTVSPGAYQQYIATGTFAGGEMQQLGSVSWSTSDTTTTQISNDATNPGASVAVGSPASTIPVTITAAAGNVGGSAKLNARPAGFVTTGSMSVQREVFHAVTLNNGQVLAVDGDTSFSGPAPAELYNPAMGTFALTGIPIAQRLNYTATLLPNGTVLIAGGTFGAALATAELYDPVTGTFSSTGSMNVARYDHTATLLVNGTVLITGGRTTGTTALASAEIYDPGSGTFTPAGNLGFARAEHTATPIAGGNVLISGGQLNGGSFPATAEIYNAFSGLFSMVGNLNVPRFDHTATLLPNGTVLIAGGAGIGSDLASAELYDPATGMFTITGSLNTPRLLHTATLLNTGMVLLAGGGNNLSPGGVLASTELYNPLTGTFTNAGALNAARLNHAAALMENGMVLIVGGASITLLSSAELY
jgi:hypothetical protein